MPTQFKYKAIGGDGTTHTGVIAAENNEKVVEYLASRDLMPVSISHARARQAFSALGFFKGSDYEDLIMFTNNLATMYRAGIPLLRILSLIKIGPENSRFNHAIQQIRYSVQSGQSLSQAMGEFDHIFSKVYINGVAAGEESGRLDNILEELAVMLEKELELSRLLKSGIRYPIIVISVIALAFVVIMGYVVPKFVAFYDSFGADLPLPTKILIGTSNFFTEYWAVLLGAVAVIVIGFKKLVANEAGKLWVDEQLLKLPVFGQLIIKGNIARFSMMFHILFVSGLPIIKALRILNDSVKNSRIGLEIKKLEELFHRGSEANLLTAEFAYFPQMAKQMMAIGLESGSLDNMLSEIGSHYSKEVQYTSRHLTAILEPLLTLVVSVFVLILALAIFLPMWNLIKVFNSG
ncbi:MAG: type II secretion system F family protein [candidate division Zixibacteria bacterium]|nr:type II secretion system F family protein [candidate division Zixibacteria bacterium]